jgi:hypothetical protein
VRALTLLISTVVVVLPKVGFAASPKEQVFDGSVSQVFSTTVTAVEKNWKKVQSSDLSTGTIRFHTSVSMTTWGGRLCSFA